MLRTRPSFTGQRRHRLFVRPTLLGILAMCLVAPGEEVPRETPPATLPAFPGAEGYGSLTRGGRGGKVIAVTNLNDSGPGSFKAACDAKGPRTVVFKVAGTIDGSVRIKNDFITIAGQTAPGDGITIKGITSGHRGMFEAAIQVIAEHGIEMLIDRTFDFDDAKAAYEYLESAAHMGKVMIRVG